MILEGIVTTINDDGSANISPMGPNVDPGMSRLQLRPFRTSTTYQNLRRTRQGVFHVTDNVELIARAAVDALDPPPELSLAEAVEGFVLDEACRWYAFRVTEVDDQGERSRMECEVVARRRLRDFFGFNRAKHAVLEAAILATRIGLLPADEIRRQFDCLEVIVDKTAGQQERRAFELLDRYVRSGGGKGVRSHLCKAPAGPLAANDS